MKKFKFYWFDGKVEVLEGNTPADALNRAGYGGGAIRALNYYENLPDLPENGRSEATIPKK